MNSSQSVVLLTSGSNHVFLGLSNQLFYEWGSNANAQLEPSLNTTLVINPPRVSTQLTYIKDRLEFWYSFNRTASIRLLAGGEAHTVAVVRTTPITPPFFNEDFVITYGNNDFGQLGVTTLAVQSELAAVAIPNAQIRTFASFEIKQVCAGGNYSAVLSVDGSIWTWGSNAQGQLGIGSYNDSAVPRLVVLAEAIQHIACGSDFMFAITVRTPVVAYSWGNNNKKQLADPTESNLSRNTPSIAFGIPPDSISQTVSPNICTGGSHGAFVSETSNTVYTWGSNEYGQLGVNKTNLEVPSSSVPLQVLGSTGSLGVWCGFAHTLLYKPSGIVPGTYNILAWGYNTSGEVGVAVSGVDGSGISGVVPYPVVIRQISVSSPGLVLFAALGSFHSVMLQNGAPEPPVGPPQVHAMPFDMMYLYPLFAVAGTIAILLIRSPGICCCCYTATSARGDIVSKKNEKTSPPPSPTLPSRSSNYNDKVKAALRQKRRKMNPQS